MSGRQPDKHRTPSIILVLLAGSLAAWGIARCGVAPARADGAFPSAQSVLLPRDRPNEIILATTFGLIFSEDDGATWRYSCENDLTRMTNGGQYMMGPPPGDRIFGTSDRGAPVSGDGACTWTLGGGDLTPMRPTDVFADPTDPSRAFALAVDESNGLESAYRSTDAGLTYSGPIFTSPMGGLNTGIESSA